MSQIQTKYIANNAVTNAKAAQMPTNTVKGNNTGGTANATDLTVSQAQTLLAIPTASSPLPINAGGTDNGSLSVAAGGVIYTDGTKFQNVGAGTGGQILQSNGSSAPSWVAAGTSGITVVSKTANYNIATTDYVILVSGAAFSVTLPTAVGVTGKVYQIVKTDSSLANQITIDTTSSQTIGGISGGSAYLNTLNESWTVVSDGSNWQLLEHYTDVKPTSYTPTITGFTTVTNNTAYWTRSGSYILIQGFFDTGTPQSSLASVALPTNVTMDSGSVTPGNTTSTAGGTAGTFTVQASNAFGQVVTASGTSTSVVYFAGSGTAASSLTPVNGNAFTGSSGIPVSYIFRIPVSNWNP